MLFFFFFCCSVGAQRFAGTSRSSGTPRSAGAYRDCYCLPSSDNPLPVIDMTSRFLISSPQGVAGVDGPPGPKGNMVHPHTHTPTPPQPPLSKHTQMFPYHFCERRRVLDVWFRLGRMWPGFKNACRMHSCGVNGQPSTSKQLRGRADKVEQPIRTWLVVFLFILNGP